MNKGDAQAMKTEFVKEHLGFLDLLRGFLAFWVYYAHLKMAAIGKDVIWGSPTLAVDGFMILSGFLMTYHWTLREGSFKTFWEQAKDFYLRRFFRIAPLYYAVLMFVYFWELEFWKVRNSVIAIVPPAWGGEINEVYQPILKSANFRDIVTHFSFTFGLIPKYVNNNILPDWSISLEMQFYVLFPLLLLILSRFGSIATTFGVFITTLATNKFIGLYEHAGLLAHFPQPAFILFKLNFFLSGMAIAYAYLSKDDEKRIYWILLGLLILFNAEFQVYVVVILMILLLIFEEGSADFITRFGNGKISKFVGQTSYGLYLLHIPIMYVVLYLLFKETWYLEMAIYPRLLITMLIVSPLVYGLSYLTFKVIEMPGIQLGKSIAGRIKSNG